MLLAALLAGGGLLFLAAALRWRPAYGRVLRTLRAYDVPSEAVDAAGRRRRWAWRPALEAAWEAAARAPLLGSHMERLERWLTRQLVHADLALTAREVVLLAGGLVVGGCALGWLLFGTALFIAASGLGALAGLAAYLRVRQRRRVRRFGQQLPDVLSMLIIAIRSGQTVPQALDTMSRQIRAPAGVEFAVVVRELGLGVPPEQALSNLAARIANEDLRLLVTAVRIQREKGGNLVDMLTTIEQTVRQRVLLRRMVASLTAQARMGAWIITLLPVALAGILYLLNRAGMAFFWTDPLGIGMAVGASGSVILGNVVLRKFTNIEL